MMTEVERLEARALEPVARCLIRHLHVPLVYFEAPWPTARCRQDVLAIDRAGSGDLHVAEVKRSAAEALSAIPQLMAVPAHYRWAVYLADPLAAQGAIVLAGRDELWSPEGPGRIGVIEVQRVGEDELVATVKTKAERFLGLRRSKVEKFRDTHEADIGFE